MPQNVTVCWTQTEGEWPGETMIWVEPGLLTEEQVQESAFQVLNDGVDRSMEDFLPKEDIYVSTRKPSLIAPVTVYYKHTDVVASAGQ